MSNFNKVLEKALKDSQGTQRIGQLICNSLKITCPELFYIRDEDLINNIQNFHEEVIKKTKIITTKR